MPLRASDVSPVRRVVIALSLVTSVLVFGFVGYVLLGFDPVDSIYQTVITISTVGFDEVEHFGQAFTAHLRSSDRLVVIDSDPAQLASCPYPYVLAGIPPMSACRQTQV